MSAFRPSSSPAFRLALLVVAGILLSRWTALPLWLLVLILSAVTLLAVNGLILSKLHTSLGWVVSLVGAFACIFAGATKYAADSDRSFFAPDSVLSQNAAVVGTIGGIPHVTGKVTRFVINAHGVKVGSASLMVSENVRVTITRPRNELSLPNLHYGMTIVLYGRLSRPSDSRNPGEFSEKQYNEANGITMFMLVRGGSHVVVLDTGRGSWLMRTLVVPAYDYTIRLLESTTKGESAEFLKGLLIGERSGISVSTRQAFTNSGVAHVLAVSGSNVVVVAAVFFFVFGLLRFPKWAIVLSSILVLILYMLVTGSQPPVVRATVISSIFLLGSLVQVKSNPYNSLGVAAVIILAYDARQLFDVGFQLSFVAVLSIVYLYPKMNSWISHLGSESVIRKAIVWTLRVCAVSLAASLGTLPLTAVYFGKVSLIGLLANIVVIPAVGASVILGFVTILSGLFSIWVAATYAAVNQLLLDVTLWVIQMTGAAPFAFMETSRFLPIYALPFYAALLLVFNFTEKRDAKTLTFVLLLSLNLVVFVPTPEALAASNGMLRVSFLDVGQGDASVVELPDGKVIVIDVGPRANEYDAGERVVAAFLKRRGVTRVDMLVISHPHDDHFGGAPYILEHFDVDNVLESGQAINTPIFELYSRSLCEERCHVDTARSGMCVKIFSGVRLYIVAPTQTFIDTDTTHRHLNLNNTSVAMRMQFGDVSFFFSGDAEADAEEGMVRQYGGFLKSALLKTGHHGSNTGSTQDFLNAVQPRWAVISVGRLNNFGHPSREVIARLQEMQTEVCRTDEDGAIIFESDGKTVSRVDWR